MNPSNDNDAKTCSMPTGFSNDVTQFDRNNTAKDLTALYQELQTGWIRVIRVVDLEDFCVELLPCRLRDQEPEDPPRRHGIDINGDKSDYVAVSYTWGDMTDLVDIKIQDVRGSSHSLKVTKSTVAAVRHLASNVDYLWIDQICMNQTSLDEKAVQVALMRKIYEYAGEVRVWLREPFDRLDLAINTIKEAGRMLDEASRRLSKAATVAEGIGHLNDAYKSSFNIHDNDVWIALHQFFSSPWFSRAWIWQEATAKPEQEVILFVGSETVTLLDAYHFSIAYIFLRSEGDIGLNRQGFDKLIYPGAYFLTQIAGFHSSRRSGEPMDFIQLLNMLRPSSSTDSRDKVYCMLPFAYDPTGVTRSNLLPNYRIPWSQVRVMVVLWFLKQYKTLDFFSCCWNQRSAETFLPTWAPDWSANYGPAPFVDLIHLQQFGLFHASAPFEKIDSIAPTDTFDHDFLALEGVFLTKVAKDFPAFSLDQKLDFVRTLTSWKEACEDGMCPLTGKTRMQVLSHTIVADRQFIPQKDQFRYERGHFVDLDLDLSILQDTGISNLIPNRSLILTPSPDEQPHGLIGLCSSDVIPGDEIWMLKGGRMLYVLRPCSVQQGLQADALDLTGQPHHPKVVQKDGVLLLFVSECFILGLMDGEVFEMMGDKPKRKKPDCLGYMSKEFYKIYIA